jgi:hypothetical protein
MLLLQTLSCHLENMRETNKLLNLCPPTFYSSKSLLCREEQVIKRMGDSAEPAGLQLNLTSGAETSEIRASHETLKGNFKTSSVVAVEC